MSRLGVPGTLACMHGAWTHPASRCQRSPARPPWLTGLVAAVAVCLSGPAYSGVTVVVPRPLPPAAIGDIVRVFVVMSEVQESLLRDVILDRYAQKADDVLARSLGDARAWEARWGRVHASLVSEGRHEAFERRDVRLAAERHAEIRFNALASYRRLQRETLGEFSVFVPEEERDALALAAMQVDREQMGQALAIYARQSLVSSGTILAAAVSSNPRLGEALVGARPRLLEHVGSSADAARRTCERIVDEVRSGYVAGRVRVARQNLYCGASWDEARCLHAAQERRRERERVLSPLHAMLREEHESLRALMADVSIDLGDAIGRAWGRHHMWALEEAGFFHERDDRRVLSVAGRMRVPGHDHDDDAGDSVSQMRSALVDAIEARRLVRVSAIDARRAWCAEVNVVGGYDPAAFERHRAALLEYHSELRRLGDDAAALLEHPILAAAADLADRAALPLLAASLRALPPVPEQSGHEPWPGARPW